jgi:SET domain-containing protein
VETATGLSDTNSRREYSMLLISTRVGPSTIHGVGVFACEPVVEGQIIWRFEPVFDRMIEDVELSQAPDVFRVFLHMYAYRSVDLGGGLVLPCDHARFLNHSPDPNTAERPYLSFARRPIGIGEEITCDYGAFCTDWDGFD